MTRQGRRWLVATSWLAAFFRYPALFANSFHNDEALFASWARLIAIWSDPLLQGQHVDKPPLLFYLQAVFYPLQGPVEWAARMPGFIASILLVPLLGVLVWQLYRDELAAVAASLILAMSPLTIQFSATAFTDPLLTFALIISLYFVVWTGAKQPNLARAGRAAGFWFGAAVATKHQAWLFLPLLLGIALLQRWNKLHWRHALIGFVPWLFALLLWDLTRTGRLDLWSTQINNFGGIRAAWSWELAPRWDSWLNLWRWISAVPLLLLLLPLVLWPFWSTATYRGALVNQLTLLYLLGYWGMHWLLAIPVWDRYLLPIAPLVVMLLSWAIAQPLRSAAAYVRSTSERFRAWVPAGRAISLALFVLLLVQLPAAAAARRGVLPIGGQSRADQGAAVVAHYLADAPYGTVLYDHWFSWQWRYHLLDRRVYVSWFPHPDALVTDLLAFAGNGPARYLALPSSDAALPVMRVLGHAGFQLLPVAESGAGAIDLYQILPQGSANE